MSEQRALLVSDFSVDKTLQGELSRIEDPLDRFMRLRAAYFAEIDPSVHLVCAQNSSGGLGEMWARVDADLLQSITYAIHIESQQGDVA